MAFPTSPVDGQLYTNALGTQYRYVLADIAWKIVNGGGGGGTIGGSGTAGYLAKFSDSTTLADSPFSVTGTQTTVLSTKHNANADGSNLFLGGGGQSISGVGGQPALGSNNTSLGKAALNAVVYGHKNTAIGVDAAKLLSGGLLNTAVGYNALSSAVDANTISNVAVGETALAGLTTGSSNVAVGASAIRYNLEGGYNTAIGNGTGIIWGPDSSALTNPGYCTYIGQGCHSGHTDGTPQFETIIGANNGYTRGLGSNSVLIGNSTTTKAAIWTDAFGIDTTAPKGIIHAVATGTAETVCMVANVGNATATTGTFTRDSTAWVPMTRTDAGTLTDGGVLEIIGSAGHGPDGTGCWNFMGTGFVWSTQAVTGGVCWSNFSFNEDGAVLYNTLGDVSSSDSPNALCIYPDGNTTTSTSKLIIKNNNGSTVRMGYWVKYWIYAEQA